MISGVIIIAALPLIALIAGMVANERRGEIGLLMSMGARRDFIFSLIIAESLILAVIGGIAGVVVSFAAITLLNSMGFLTSILQVSFRMPSSASISFLTAVTLIIVLLVGTVASLWPAYRSSRMDAYEAIRTET